MAIEQRWRAEGHRLLSALSFHCVFWGLNSGREAWWQTPWSTEPTCQPSLILPFKMRRLNQREVEKDSLGHMALGLRWLDPESINTHFIKQPLQWRPLLNWLNTEHLPQKSPPVTGSIPGLPLWVLCSHLLTSLKASGLRHPIIKRTLNKMTGLTRKTTAGVRTHQWQQAKSYGWMQPVLSLLGWKWYRWRAVIILQGGLPSQE